MKKKIIDTLAIVFLIVMVVNCNMADSMELIWKKFWLGFDIIGLITVFIYYGYMRKDSVFYQKMDKEN